MSEANDPKPNGRDADTGRPGPQKSPRRLNLTATAAFAVLAVVGIVLAKLVGFGAGTAGSGDDVRNQAQAEAMARRIQPVAAVTLAEPAGAGVPRTGEQVYQMQCSACHANGVVGAPKFGDAAAWGPRIPVGFDALLNSALKGKNSMTPQGGGQFSNFEVGRAVVYMANRGGAKFADPEPSSAAASAVK